MEIVEDTVDFSFGFKIKIHNSNSTSLFLVSFCRQKTKENWKLSASCLNHDFYANNKPFKEKENQDFKGQLNVDIGIFINTGI